MAKAKLNKQSLTQIARQLTALDKTDVKTAIEKGRLLQLAFDEYEGTYTEWLGNIGWSERSALRYRNVYALAQTNRQIAGLFVSISTLHLIADPSTTEKERKAIIKAALKGRVSHSEAQAIIDKLDVPPPITPRPPREPPSVEPLDDDYDPTADDESTDDESTDAEPDDSEPPNELAEALNMVLRYSECDPAWAKAAKTIGAINLLGLSEILQSVYGKYFKNPGVKAAADRAAARSAKSAKTREEEEAK